MSESAKSWMEIIKKYGSALGFDIAVQNGTATQEEIHGWYNPQLAFYRIAAKVLYETYKGIL